MILRKLNKWRLAQSCYCAGEMRFKMWCKFFIRHDSFSCAMKIYQWGLNVYFRILENCFHSYCWKAHISIAFEDETFLQGNNWLFIKILIVKVWCLTFSLRCQHIHSQPLHRRKTILKVILGFCFYFVFSTERRTYIKTRWNVKFCLKCPYH